MSRAALLSLSLLVGCSFEPPPDIGDIDAGIDAQIDASEEPGPGRINATWTLVNAGNSATCPAGATTAAINVQRVGGTRYTDIFSCSDLMGHVEDLPVGSYHVWIELTNDAGNVLYAQSETADLEITSAQTVPASFTVDVANGFFRVSWQIVAANGGHGCAAVPNDGVGVLTTLAGTSQGQEDLFDCVDGEAPNLVTTGARALGDHVIAMSLLDAAGASVGNAPPQTATITWGNQFVTVPTATITEGQ